MKKSTFLLFMAILMIILTTMLIFTAFIIIDADVTNIFLISSTSVLGYLGGFLYLDLYLKTKNKSF